MNFAANCTILGIPDRSGDLSEVFRDALISARIPKCGVFVTLKNSNLVWRLYLSPSAKFLKTEKSPLTYPGPRTRFRPALPTMQVPVKPALLNAAVLKYSIKDCPPGTSFGFPIRFGRTPGQRVTLPFLTILMGRPVRAVSMPESCHPPRRRSPFRSRPPRNDW